MARTTQIIPLPPQEGQGRSRRIVVTNGQLDLAGAAPRPQVCTDGSLRRQLINGVYVDGTTVPCKQIVIEGHTFDVVQHSIGLAFHVED